MENAVVLEDTQIHHLNIYFFIVNTQLSIEKYQDKSSNFFQCMEF